VGREREMVEVKRELAMTRLLTITGAGGSGKTRLAMEVARDLLEASVAVGGGEGVEEDDILDVLSGLVEKSLVMVEASEGSSVRYRMLEPVRQYARAKLEEGGDSEKVQRQHAAFFLALAEDAQPRLRRREDTEWLQRVEAEHDNLRAALSWTLESEEIELALRLGGALGSFWHAHGHMGEGRKWLEAALAKDGRASMVTRIRPWRHCSGWPSISGTTIERWR
jgi:predicted ATPase